MISDAGIRPGMIPIHVGIDRDGSKRVDRIEERGYNENYTDANCCRKAPNLVGDVASSKGNFSVGSHTCDAAHRPDRGCIYLLPSLWDHITWRQGWWCTAARIDGV